MIIKRKRIKARGQALQRTLQHLSNGEDNDAVALIRGNIHDLQDARDDALRFGREYAVRHWILSPDRAITPDQLDELADRLAIEFGFDPHRIVVWRHIKGRAAGACEEHYHLCAPEVDPATGAVLSSSHDYARQSKIARAVEVAWGHAVILAPHARSIVAALEREGDTKTVTALRDIPPPDHAASFHEADHQRVKRAGLDLPRLREMISGALSAATSRGDFETRLANMGLRLRTGDQKDVVIVETADGATLLGSLARLTRLRKAALEERLRFDAAGQSAGPAKHPSGDLPPPPATRAADGARRSPSEGNQPSGRAASDGPCDPIAATIGRRDRTGTRQVGEPGSKVGRTGGHQSNQERGSWLNFVAGTVLHRDTLLDLLGDARRAALAPLDRATTDLTHVIEQETNACRPSELPEPASLLIARRKVDDEANRVQTLEAQVNMAAQQLADHAPRSVWQRLLQRLLGRIDPDRRALEIRLDQLQRQFTKANADHAIAKLGVRTEERKFEKDRARHETATSARKGQAKNRIAVARAAQRFLEAHPRAAFWGAPYLMRVAADLQKARAGWENSPELETPDWDMIPILDIWGIPYQPQAKSF